MFELRRSEKILFIVLFIISVAAYLFARNVDNYEFAKPIRSTSAPTQVTGSEVPGYHYEITQIFFETDQDNETEQVIKQLLSNQNIKYSNFRYTDKGYYTADIHYGPYSKTNYEKQAKYLLDSIVEDESCRIAMKVIIQGHYYTY